MNIKIITAEHESFIEKHLLDGETPRYVAEQLQRQGLTVSTCFIYKFKKEKGIKTPSKNIKKEKKEQTTKRYSAGFEHYDNLHF